MGPIGHKVLKLHIGEKQVPYTSRRIMHTSSMWDQYILFCIAWSRRKLKSQPAAADMRNHQSRARQQNRRVRYCTSCISIHYEIYSIQLFGVNTSFNNGLVLKRWQPSFELMSTFFTRVTWTWTWIGLHLLNNEQHTSFSVLAVLAGNSCILC